MTRLHRIAPLAVLLLVTACTRPARQAAPPPPAGLEPVRQAALPITGAPGDYDELLELIGDSRFVLLGEATHGTHEFYRERARITQRLIREKGFTAMAIEGDWPEAVRVNRYIQGLSGEETPEQALAGFHDFPAWMWGNTDVRDLVAWMRTHNQGLPADGDLRGQKVGFYGLDLYDLWGAADVVTDGLARIDPAAAGRARQRYRCFASYREDPHSYGQAVARNPKRSCAQQALEQAQELERLAARPPRADPAFREELFAVLQGARVVRGGEEYYRTMYRGGMNPWNLRDRHMADTLDALIRHLDAQGKPSKVVAWAHNTHMGDARVTQMGEAGEWNVGQLMRQRHDGRTTLVGFTTYSGTVFAASAWGERGRVRDLRPARPGSFSALFHDAGAGDFLLLLRGNRELSKYLAEPRPERAVGVVYMPQQEHRFHYFQAHLTKQFDAVIHLDETRAVEPLPRR